MNRNQWLEKALDILAEKPSTKFRIDKLCADMGVTKGSFFWHFKSREDFLRSIVKYWGQWSTEQAINAVKNVEDDASARLLALMEYVTDNDIGRYDKLIRTWAYTDPVVAGLIRKIDNERLAFIRSLFSQIGFDGDELEMRALVFAGYHSQERGFLADNNEAGRKKYLKLRHAFFVGKEG